MIPFRKMTHADIPLIASYMSSGDSEEAVLRTCGRLVEEEDVFLTVVEGMLCMRQHTGGGYVYTWPLGQGNLRLVLVQLMEDAERMSRSAWRLVGVPDSGREDAERALPSHFDFEPLGNESESLLLQLLGALEKTDELLVALPRSSYSNSLFYNNERMVPTVGEDGWES